MKLSHFITSIIIASFFIFTSCKFNHETKLVILHTNDTHSHIDPDPECDLGGALRRKVLIDSVRACEKNVLLVDAGDAVQGSLYYTFYKGLIEALMMNGMEYDIVTIGNHEFDNAMQSLANQYNALNATIVSANYDLSNTPLDTMVTPIAIKEYDGKRIAVIGLNISPENLISSRKCLGMKFNDITTSANHYAQLAKDSLNADFVVALTHIGYPADSILALNSRNIDIIIGGHSHSTINPSSTSTDVYRIKNLDNKEVLIAQTGSNGHNLGQITIDLDSRKITSRLIQVDNRLDNRLDPELKAVLSPYKHVVDSFHAIKATQSSVKLERNKEPLINFMSDFIHMRGEQLCNKHIDVAIMNRGGIRNSLPKGSISKGDLMMTFPFDNFISVIEVPGDKISCVMEEIARGNRHSISSKSITTFDPNKTYLLATIDYLAEGNDGLSMLQGCKIIHKSNVDLKDDLIQFFSQEQNKDYVIIPDTTNRTLNIINNQK